MASKAISGVGTLFRRWNGSAFENISEVNSITGPSKTRDTIDVTSLDSVGGYREHIPGFRDGGQVQLNMNFTRATYDKMNTDYESSALGYYQIVLPDTEHTTFDFAGFVTELPLSISADDKITADVTIKVSGRVIDDSGPSAGI